MAWRAMVTAVLLFASHEGVGGVQLRGIPTFPTGVGGPIAAMGNAFQENKGPKKDEGPLINKLRENAERVAGEQVAQELRTLAAKKEAYLLAHQNVVKLVHIGGCPRAYSTLCPKGWAESSVARIRGVSFRSVQAQGAR